MDSIAKPLRELQHSSKQHIMLLPLWMEHVSWLVESAAVLRCDTESNTTQMHAVWQKLLQLIKTCNLNKAHETSDRLSWSVSNISSQFTLEMCPADKIAKKNTKTSYFGGSRSCTIIDFNTTKNLITSGLHITISSISVPICNSFHARQANGVNITTVQSGIAL